MTTRQKGPRLGDYFLGHRITKTTFLGEINELINWQPINAFLSMLPDESGLTPDHIFFLVDDIRPGLYNPKQLGRASGSYSDIMSRYFSTQARKQGYQVIDMQPAFIRDYERNGKPFELSRDGHWNAQGHAVEAQQLVRALAAWTGQAAKADNTKKTRNE